MAATIWIDVEDLFDYARDHTRPTGIQRLTWQLCCTLQSQYGSSGRVQFVRHDPMRGSFRCIGWDEVAGLFGGLVQARPPESTGAPPTISPYPPTRQFVRRLAYRLPVSLRVPAIDALVAQQKAFRAWAHLARASLRSLTGVARRFTRRSDAGAEMSTRDGRDRFAAGAAQGDVLLAPGAPWAHPDYTSLIDRHRKRRGLRFALLVYDLAPLRHPEWFDRGLVRLFRSWFKDLLPACDHVFAISQATAADVEAYAREQAVTLPSAVVPIPVGTDLSLASGNAGTKRGERLPSVGSYALIVATIEIRKNHLLLFRVWQRLLKELPREHVPTLVFAGRVGWLVEDLMQQIANTDYLDGKLQIIEDPSDEELVALYSGCLFTLFPSLYEGWGLPVTESLSLGKPCFISNRTSLPEAGGALARSFDPDDLRDAYDKIRNVLDDRAELQRWEEEVRREFRPIPWSASVEALLRGLGEPLAALQASAAQRAA